MLDSFLQTMKRFTVDRVSIQDWSVFSSDSCHLSLGTKDTHTGGVHAPLSMSESCGARYKLIWSDGLISRGSLERRQMGDDAVAALHQARQVAFDDPDSSQVLGRSTFPDVALHDDDISSLARGEVERVDRRLNAVRTLVAREQCKTWSGSIGASVAQARLVTSAGLDIGGQGTSFGWHVTLNGEIGDGFGARAMDKESEFESRLERLAVTARELSRTGEPMEPGLHNILLHPNVVESYVLGTLLGNLDGATVVNGEGFFRKEQFGSEQPVLRDDLHLRLDPLQPMKSGSYRFTMEGVPAARYTFISNGCLTHPVLNLKYARRFGAAPTPVPTSMDTLSLEGPEFLSEEDGYAAIGDGAMILSVLGVHTQDGSSGDFSLSTPQALKLGGGRFQGRLRGTISGNLFTLLRSDDLRLVRFEGETTPGMLVRCRFDPK
jgi:PmbA protein